MKLTFENNQGKLEDIGEFSSRQEVFKAIDKHLHITDPFNSPYLRIVGVGDNLIMLDYGSHTSFFYVDTSWEDFMK